MAQRKIPYLKVVEPPENPKQLKKAERKVRWKKWEGAVSILILAVLAICGTYLLLDNKTYGTAREAASYTKEISDTSNYVQFAKGIIRYNRNGVVYLNKMCIRDSTTDDTSTGSTKDSVARGEHLMTGECSISKAGISRVYCYGSTTANHEVDKLAVITYVQRYHEDTDDWGQVDWFVEMKENDYFVYATKTVTVDRGYYYRVWASHIVRKGDDPVEETYSYTDGIKVP